MNITWHIKPFNKLSTMELFGLVRLRIAVFVTEQQITEPELDDQDLESYHVFGTDETGRVVGVARFFFEDSKLLVGRVAVDQSLRHAHIGSRMLIAIEDYVREHNLAETIYLHAQLYIKDFYLSLGYEPIGDIFLEADIKHIMMAKKLN
ncbi:acetyltransferase [Amylolactobacillus amylotrophicus DSM 20534]|uniref:Uncharacterized protein n=3 Tax=Amylolactobacillus TaxID=2767876 RepID=A0A1L6XDD9_9LACO|nr:MULTISPECIES: GNAT family N-acetyltransferase [Amylolactobacillus]APT18976.1 hypothetical protein LA20533_06830 [Amylolactobacillus amylophilus DSM 20533 = JCM 1125]KRK38763.1 acetyltransferase [Amylolactobacillus amylotrophicus DSM 20534]KRM42594.1 acetyltransferase [Amylolactobacillus amylophilus DSM 20533 = JCM 1125]GED79983.1 acetyltransferase [Amylolactobacillus amylophilus]